MALPPLSQFAIPAATCHLHTSLLAALAICAKNQADFVVVLDQAERPRGRLRLPQLVQLALDPATAAATVAACIEHLKPVVTVAAATPIDVCIAQLVEDETVQQVLVDEEGRYGGWINPVALLHWQVQQPTPLSLAVDVAAMELNSAQLVEALALPCQVQTRSGQAVAVNEAWQQAIDPTGQPFGASSTWQFHRLPLAGVGTADELSLVMALPQGVDSMVVNGWLTGIGHELKSPLTSLLGLSTLLLDQRLGQLAPQQQRYAQLIQKTVRQLVATVNDLLDWVRLDSGQMALRPVPVALKLLQGEIQQQLLTQDLGAEKQACWQPLRWQVDGQVETVLADPLRLRQLLLHLLSYSIARSEDCRTPCGFVAERWGSWAALTVYSGAKIPEIQQSRLFQPQRQEQSLTKLELGPALAWRLARLHGGDISLMTMPQGSRLTVLLPLLESREPAATSLVVLVADEPPLIERAAAALDPTRCRVAIARTLYEAVDKAQRLRPELMLVAPEALPVEPSLDYLYQRLDARLPVVTLIRSRATASSPSLPIDELGPPLPPLLRDLLLQSSRPPLTVLYLRLSEEDDPIGEWLHQYQCRVLEVDDLSQADLLARVWKPDVMVLDTPRPQEDIRDMVRLEILSRCPLVVLTAAAATAAAAFPQLRWRACLGADLRQGAQLLQTLHESVQAAQAAQASPDP